MAAQIAFWDARIDIVTGVDIDASIFPDMRTGVGCLDIAHQRLGKMACVSSRYRVACISSLAVAKHGDYDSATK